MAGIGPVRGEASETMAYLDSNESPLGCSPKAVERMLLGARTTHRYPGRLRQEITDRLVSRLETSPGSILLTAGVDEAIDITLAPGARARYVVPGFTGYFDRASALGIETLPILLGDDWQPVDDLPELEERDVVYVAQPHNPTGNFFRRGWLGNVMGRAGLFVLDQTYLDFADNWTPPPIAGNTIAGNTIAGNTVVFRSFSKAYGLAGLRIGMLWGEADLLHKLSLRQRFASINSCALHALAGALEDDDHLRSTVDHVSRSRPYLCELLVSSGLFADVRSTQGNFVVARCQGSTSSGELTRQLASHGVLVRDCESMGLPGWIRVTVGSKSEIALLRSGLQAIHSASVKARR